MNTPQGTGSAGPGSLQRMVRPHGPTAQAIMGEIYRACEILGGDFLLLSAIGSWGDTLPDVDVLANLSGWNRDHDPKACKPPDGISGRRTLCSLDADPQMTAPKSKRPTSRKANTRASGARRPTRYDH